MTTCDHVRQFLPGCNHLPEVDLPCANPDCREGTAGTSMRLMGPTTMHYIQFEREQNADSWRWAASHAMNSHGVPMSVTAKTDCPCDRHRATHPGEER